MVGVAKYGLYWKEGSYYKGEVYAPKLHYNPRGFTYEEAVQCIQRENWQKADIILIEEEIEEYNLQRDPSHK